MYKLTLWSRNYAKDQKFCNGLLYENVVYYVCKKQNLHTLKRDTNNFAC